MSVSILSGILILFGLFLLIIAVYAKYTLKHIEKDKPKYKRQSKYFSPKYKYYKNEPEHIDVSGEYIEKIWDEINN